MEYKLLYPVTGAAVYGNVLRGDNMTRTEADYVALTEETTYDYTGTIGVTLQPDDALAYYLKVGADYIPIPTSRMSEYRPEVTAVGSTEVTPAGYVGDYLEDDTVYFLWRTNETPTVNGTIRVYRDSTDTEVAIPTGITDTRDFDSISGLNLCQIDLSANSFYLKNGDYSVVLAAATINGNTVNAVIATFSIENRYAGVEFIRQG